MQRLCSLHILCCVSYLLVLWIFSNDVRTLVTALCDQKETRCANLGDISAPFWSSMECAASDSFVISNCSAEQASWKAFEDAVHYEEGSPDLGAPELLGLNTQGGYTYLNLTWQLGMTEVKSGCTPLFLSAGVDLMLPDVINLTSFANGSLEFSPYNIYLLFNCANLDDATHVVVESIMCGAYKEQCQQSGLSCAQLKPKKELSLRATLASLSCSHYMFLATSNLTISIPQWQTSTIQLQYVDAKCLSCFNSGGTCSYNTDTRNFQQCNCTGDSYSDTDCYHLRTSCNSVSCKKSFKIAIAALGTILSTVAIMLLFLWVYQKKRGYSTKSFSIPSSNRLLTQRAYMLSKKFGPVATKEFSFESLSKATKSFADELMIGDGGFGAVYLGILKDGRKVAVKRLYHDNFKRMDHFYNEIKILSTLDHPNLVKLYGFCCQDSSDLLLVFEYAANGTVSDQLHDATKPSLPWKTRLNIARETAEALSYLHNSVIPPIYHRDVKTTNILLDDDLHVKLADFGLSRLVPLEATHVSTAPQGTPGYLDPDYHQCYQLTDKSDVYSFGVVLVELVSAKLAVDMSRDRREINLSSLALMKIGCGMWEELVDPRLEMKKNPEVEMMVKRVVELAFMCLHAEKDSRPTMEFVAETLTKLCQEFGYGDGNGANGFPVKVDLSPTSSFDETLHLIRAKSASKSKRASANSTPTSTDWSTSSSSS